MAKKRRGSLKWLSKDHKHAAQAGMSYEAYMAKKAAETKNKKLARALHFTIKAKKMQPETARKILRATNNKAKKRIPKPPFKPMISVSLEE